VADQRFDSILARKLNTFIPLSLDELKCLADMQAKPFNVKRGRQLTHEGQIGHKAYVLQEGWACSYKLLPDGKRQIISFPIAGDIVGPKCSFADSRPLLLGVDRCRGQSRGGHSHDEVRDGISASRCCFVVGSLA